MPRGARHQEELIQCLGRLNVASLVELLMIRRLMDSKVRGYRKPDRVRALEKLKPLHGSAEFEAILKEMAAEPPR